ncbi:MAG: hypothetical protein KGI00_04850 [Candidatus Micrarchaeota archaeon]|nr:hypothetical protein [Candidatus Micrarchaeota archaeon]MDE1850029.1 hypothetical protein [Candidatus Micrarchaeota archaeon]
MAIAQKNGNLDVSREHGRATLTSLIRQPYEALKAKKAKQAENEQHKQRALSVYRKVMEHGRRRASSGDPYEAMRVYGKAWDIAVKYNLEPDTWHSAHDAILDEMNKIGIKRKEESLNAQTR